MRPLVILVLAPILALGLVVSAGVLVPDDPSTLQPKPQSIVWANRVFTSKADFARWLERHDRSYEQWVKRHPSATWFHRQPPIVAAPPAKPASVKAAEVDRHFARIFVAAGFGLLALLLAAAVIRAGSGSRPTFRRARRLGPRPLRPPPTRALGDGAQATVATPGPLATMALPNGTEPVPAPSGRRRGNVVPLYRPPEPVVARPTAAHELPVVDVGPTVVAEPSSVVHLEPAFEPALNHEPLIVSEAAVVSWKGTAPDAEPAPEREPVPKAEHELRDTAEAAVEPAPPEPSKSPAIQPQPPIHPQPVVHPKPAAHKTRRAATKPAPLPIVAPLRVDEARTEPDAADEAPTASAQPVEEPSAPTEPMPDEHAALLDETVAHPQAKSCEIGVWQGYRKSQFYARVVGPDGEEYAVAQSETFRSKSPPAPDEVARAAHIQLAQQLLERGWKPDGSGDEWWALRFRLHEESLPD